MSITRLEHRPSRSDFFYSGNKGAAPFQVMGRDFSYTGSGKATLSVILRHLAKTGVLASKMNTIHMPSWLGTAVSQTAMEYAFPVTEPDRNSKVIMPYHQYGFPQDMDKVLDYAMSTGAVVIEDCAHAAFGSYKGRRLGTMGEFALFSFSKFAFVRMLGGVGFSDETFKETLVESHRQTSPSLSWLLNNFKTFDEWNLSRQNGIFPRKSYLFRKMLYAVYGDTCKPSLRSVGLWERKWRDEERERNKIYAFYHARFARLGLCDHLEQDGVTPYAVPLRVRDGDTGKLAASLTAAGFESGVRMFDLNRFFVEPDFKPCVIVPAHSGLGLVGAEKVATIVESVL